jgi:hypothetical protein
MLRLEQNVQSTSLLRYSISPLSQTRESCFNSSDSYLSLEINNYIQWIFPNYDKEFYGYIDDAIKRYKLVNHTEEYDITPAKTFLSAIKPLTSKIIRHISFYDDAVKVRIIYNQREYIIDYDYEEPECVFVSTFEGKTLLMKDGSLVQLRRILESF